MKDLVLILFGAILSCGTTFLVDWIKCYREEKLYYKRKREETYIEMQDFITDLNAHWKELKVNILNNNLRNRYNALRSKTHIYAKKEIVDFFYELANNLMAGKQDTKYQEKNDTLIKLVKQDLNIKD